MKMKRKVTRARSVLEDLKPSVLGGFTALRYLISCTFCSSLRAFSIEGPTCGW